VVLLSSRMWQSYLAACRSRAPVYWFLCHLGVIHEIAADGNATDASRPGLNANGRMTVYSVPPNLIQFVSMEGEQFLVSLANNRDDLAIISRLQGLYDAALAKVTVHENHARHSFSDS